MGDPRWKDGSIIIHNLDYSDNGTFTCDVKNPPDIVGKTSQVTLYVFEKGARARGRREGAGLRGPLSPRPRAHSRLPPSAHEVRGGAGRRDRGRLGAGAAAVAALLPGALLLAA